MEANPLDPVAILKKSAIFVKGIFIKDLIWTYQSKHNGLSGKKFCNDYDSKYDILRPN